MTHPAENELLIEHGAASLLSKFTGIWAGRVVVTFDGQTYTRILKWRFSMKKAEEDARKFGEWVRGEIQNMGFDEVRKW